jgi:hypothetical protein
MTEPSPLYDVGPYAGPPAARAQFDALAFNIAVDDTDGLSAMAAAVIAKALLDTGVATTDYETGHRDAIGRQLDPETAVVVAGWIRRAWLAGTGATPPAAARAQP